VGLSAWVGDKRFELGDASFLKAWFSTICARLEGEDWGSRFPLIMQDFYSGALPHDRAGAALAELTRIREGLAALPSDKVIWDFENRTARPPWGNAVSPHIRSLGDYFATSDGENLFEVLADAFSEALKAKRDVVIS
jgi:hypothetical protein